MGRRSRKRGVPSSERSAPAAAAGRDPEPAPRPARRRGERPPAPWGSFPLVELCILLALALFAAGLILGGRRGQAMAVAGVALACLAGLELSVREHFAGYRSHTTLLAGTAAVLVLGGSVFAGIPRAAMLAAAAAVFVAAFALLRGAFRRRSGGLGFR